MQARGDAIPDKLRSARIVGRALLKESLGYRLDGFSSHREEGAAVQLPHQLALASGPSRPDTPSALKAEK